MEKAIITADKTAHSPLPKSSSFEMAADGKQSRMRNHPAGQGGMDGWEVSDKEIRLATKGKEDWNLLDKKLEPGPHAKAGGNCFHLSHKAATSRHAQDMI